MSIGAGILLFVIGAVLAFAIDPNLGGGFVNLDLTGFIMMGAGVVVFVIGLVLMFKKRSATTATSTHVDQTTGERVDRRETVSSAPTNPTI